MEMIGVFGGTLHCYLGPGGCRRQGLYFSRTQPRKHLKCRLVPAGAGHAASGAEVKPELSVSHDLAPSWSGPSWTSAYTTKCSASSG
jgi:hypothetical protein